MKKILYTTLGLLFSSFYLKTFAIIATRECEESEMYYKYIMNPNIFESIFLFDLLLYYIIIVLITFLLFFTITKIISLVITKKNKSNTKYKIKHKKIYLLITIFISSTLFLVLIGAYNNLLIKERTPKNGVDCYLPIRATVKKPVIYLYPEKKQKIKVRLDYKGKIIADYPEYDEKIKGWEVLAYPDSKIIDLRNGKEYSYLFWEGIPKEKIEWDLNTGFIVKGKDAREFLEEKLSYLGLTPKEYNEFIVYWYPIMMENKYNLIHFATKQYTDSAPLKITPKPDSILRVFMIIKPLKEKIKIKEQILEKFERKGFAVIEWGGTDIY